MKEALGMITENIMTGALSIAAAYMAYFIRQAALKIKADIASRDDERQVRLFSAAADRVAYLAQITVTATEQTAAEALREAVKAGKADRQLLLDLGRDAVLQIKEQLSDEYKAVITMQCNDLDAYISNVVEDKVYALKKGGC